MPVRQLTQEEQTTAISSASPEFVHFMAGQKVDIESIGKLTFAGFKSMSQFYGMVDTKEELKELLKDEFGLDAKASLLTRSTVTDIIVAWEKAALRIKKEAESEAAAAFDRVTAPIPAEAVVAMRIAFESKWWELEDSKAPAKSYLEKKMESVALNEPRAEPLTEVISKTEDDKDADDYLKVVWTASGEMKAKK